MTTDRSQTITAEPPKENDAAWSIDAEASTVEFRARQAGVTVKGAFTRLTGTLEIDRNALENSSARVAIDATSLETALPGFAAILEARDFLDVAGHPTIEFHSSAVRRQEDGFEVEGRLIFRGEERPVTVHAAAPEFVGASAVRIVGRASLRGLVADEELEIKVHMEAARAAEHARPAAAPRHLGATARHDASAGGQRRGGSDERSGSRRVRVLGLVGSYRQGSLNQALMAAAREVAPPWLEIVPFDLRPLPFYDADLEAAGDPEPVRRLKQQIGEADALLIATPEYNRGLPARIKNAIDWASRPPFATPLAQKPVALIGASTGRSGARHALADARASLEYSRARLLDREVTVPRAHDLLDEEGRLADRATRDQLAELLARLAEHVRAARRAA